MRSDSASILSQGSRHATFSAGQATSQSGRKRQCLVAVAVTTTGNHHLCQSTTFKTGLTSRLALVANNVMNFLPEEFLCWFEVFVRFVAAELIISYWLPWTFSDKILLSFLNSEEQLIVAVRM